MHFPIQVKNYTIKNIFSVLLADKLRVDISLQFIILKTLIYCSNKRIKYGSITAASIITVPSFLFGGQFDKSIVSFYKTPPKNNKKYYH